MLPSGQCIAPSPVMHVLLISHLATPMAKAAMPLAIVQGINLPAFKMIFVKPQRPRSIIHVVCPLSIIDLSICPALDPSALSHVGASYFGMFLIFSIIEANPLLGCQHL